MLVILIVALVYVAGAAWGFIRSGGAVVDWTWPLRALAVVWYLIGPSRR